MGFLSTSPALFVTEIAFDPSEEKPVAGVGQGPGGLQEKFHALKWSSGHKFHGNFCSHVTNFRVRNFSKKVVNSQTDGVIKSE